MKTLDELEKEIDALCEEADGVLDFQNIQINLLAEIFNKEQMKQPVKQTPIKLKEPQQSLSNVSTGESIKGYLPPLIMNTVNKFESSNNK